MPRGDNPNSRANLNRGKPFSAETARKAAEESAKQRTANASLNADLRERCTPERIRKINERILSMAELKAYELIRDGLGEKPKETVNVTAEVSDKFDAILSQIGGEGLEE